nr:RNA-directed DNA polymerase, eukaryota [Tanacetum cinerariifolium]
MALAYKDKGGLGVSSIFALNRGLMFKWIWRFYTQDTSLWVRVIKAIYGEAGNMDAKVKAGEFSVASVRQLIDDKTLPEVDSKTRWIKYVPITVNVLAWKVKSDSLPTRFNVSRRGIPIDSIKCGICDTGAETSSHLFFSCCMVRQTVRISYAEFESYEDWLAWLVNLRLPSKNKLILEGVFYVMWWYMWSFNNKMIFEAKILAKAVF